MSSRDGIAGPADRFARWAIHHAARRTPAPLSERLEEEWLADLEARRAGLSRVCLGLGCCWAAAVIANEHFAPATAAATPTGNKTMASYAQADSSFLSRRATALIVIVCLHVLLISVFASGLAQKVVVQVLPPEIKANVSQVERPRDPPPPLPQVTFTQRRIDIPVQVVSVDIPTGPDVIQDAIVEPPPAIDQPPPPPQRLVNRVVGGPGKGFPNTEDYYPPAAIRLGEEGSTVVHVCVNSLGRLTTDPTVAKSSGISRIDQGALKLARDGSGHYRATTEDGRAVDSCYPILIKFQIRK